jgi:hypothetical protein
VGIVTASLPEGAIHLRRAEQPASAADIERDDQAKGRERARLITMAWGDRYIDDLIEITIPALLAPGNLPAFAEGFYCEFVIVTETRVFDRIARSAAIAALLDFADLRLVPIDDLLSPWYGITLTYALVRGFADLGAAMTRTHLVFLNADFILADGCYRRLAEAIKSGERLVVAPSYCMNLEDTIDELRRRRDHAGCTLSLPSRELARLVIDHRHNTIRAKTVNQRMFRIHRYDQFYWYVDEATLLGRQMPIAVVYMRPERALTEMPTFWDYGVVREYCPTIVPHVLGDSDDFLMAELRNKGTFRELLHLGWPTVKEIAADLSSFTTRDHRDYGRYTLVLHAEELPPDIDTQKAELGKFVDQVYARLKPPLAHRNHPFWAPQFPRFIARQRRLFDELRAEEAAAAALVDHDPRAAWRRRQIENLSTGILAGGAELRALREQLAEKRRLKDARLAETAEEFRRRRTAIECQMRSGAAADLAAIAGLESALDKRAARLVKLRQQQRRAVRGSLAAPRPPIHSPAPDLIRGTRGLRGRVRERETWRQLRSQAARTGAAGYAFVYRKTFGSLPHTTALHPYHAMLQPALTALRGAASTAHALIVSSGGELTTVVARELTGEKLAVTPDLLASESYCATLRGRPKFDLCLCDLAADDLLKFCEIFDRMRPLLAKNSRTIVSYHNLSERKIDQWTYEFTRGLFPLTGHSQIVFAGSLPGALAVCWFTRALKRCNVGTPMGMLALAVMLAVCAPLAWLAWQLDRRREVQRLPAHCTSMTIVIDLP